ncbi:MAG: 1,4-dihydroxy-2-naphthoate polyprenyltransferase [Chloroflexota bacterium]|nr:MAG: 1,4-dihydroxy-2-naphthoate polyprenyltransferase [Chloroflexota bacterium]
MTSTNKETPQNLKPWQVWLLAARPKTLPAAAAPVIVGSALAFADGRFRPGPAAAALLAALLLQIGANIANDVFDYYRGADTVHRVGPLRVTQAGLLTPPQVLLGMWITFSLAALLGAYLIAVAGWPVLLVGLSAIIAAIAYTGGPFPFGYYGLGDLFVFLFFGVAAVCGTYFVQAGQVSAAAAWAAVPMGMLVTAILVVNNLRDIETDRLAGKQTLAVRLGAGGARLEYLTCLAVAYAVPLVMALGGWVTFWALLSWLSLPLVVPLVRMIYSETGRPLNRALAGTGRLALVFGLFFSLGIVLPNIVFAGF